MLIVINIFCIRVGSWGHFLLNCNWSWQERISFSCETLYSRSCNSIHADNSNSDWPGLPLTFSTLHFDLCTDLQSPSPSEVLCLRADLVHFLIIIYVTFKIFFWFFLYLFPGQQWLSCAELEWRVRSKTVNGAGSLWGNKRQHHRPWFLLSLINLSFVFSSLKFVLCEV